MTDATSTRQPITHNGRPAWRYVYHTDAGDHLGPILPRQGRNYVCPDCGGGKSWQAARCHACYTMRRDAELDSLHALRTSASP